MIELNPLFILIESISIYLNRLWIYQDIDLNLLSRCIERSEIVIESHKECICDIGIIETYINLDAEYITLNCIHCDKEIDRELYYEVIHG